MCLIVTLILSICTVHNLVKRHVRPLVNGEGYQVFLSLIFTWTGHITVFAPSLFTPTSLYLKGQNIRYIY